MASKSTNKKIQKKVKKVVKKTHKGYLVIAAIFLIIGIAVGYILMDKLTANDTFELIGNKNTIVNIGDTFSYKDEGVKYISFGKDESGNVKISTNMTLNDGKYTIDTSEEDEFYIIYEVTSGRCKGYTLYRTFTVQSSEGN